MNCLKKLVLLPFCLILMGQTQAQEHPSIMMTKKNVAAIRKGVNTYPLLKNSYAKVKLSADLALKEPMRVPTPADGGGGYTHEIHKKNYANILNCGIAYQVSGDQKYAAYISTILLKYATEYEKWPMHPKRKIGEGGKMFWQSLNDFVWQFYTIQGYDLAYNAISAKDRQTIEKHLFLPIMNFFTIDCKETFDKIHNHGTWNLAAVGMTGYVLNKPGYVEMAIKGSAKDGKTGYLAQLDHLFSPDGYYTEGPYYQRYALLPFVLFAKAIHNYQPELKIFSYRNQLLAKAINTSLQLTYTNGAFFPMNDAIKDKTYESVELVYGLDIAYADINPQPELLDIAEKQNSVIISDAGLKIAAAIAAGKTKPFKYTSQWIGDGAKGTEGGVGILRSGSNTNQQCLVFKAAAQGMGHGHFDRLNILYYDHGQEVFADYGASRFINIETKGGGGYLPENNSWAKQTVAHNTLVVDQTSAFKAKVKTAEKYHPNLLTFKTKANIQVVSASEDNAYPGVKLVRTTALLNMKGLKKALLVDVFKATSAEEHQYDLPFWYKGHLVDASFTIAAAKDNLKALGTQYGYQHLWLNSHNSLANGKGYVTILNANNFHTTTFASANPSGLELKLVSLGANDPQMNLVDSKAFMLSQSKAKNQTFVSITENHGSTEPIAEVVSGAAAAVTDVTIRLANDQLTVFSFQLKGKQYTLTINYADKNNFIQITQ